VLTLVAVLALARDGAAPSARVRSDRRDGLTRRPERPHLTGFRWRVSEPVEVAKAAHAGLIDAIRWPEDFRSRAPSSGNAAIKARRADLILHLMDDAAEGLPIRAIPLDSAAWCSCHGWLHILAK
jgi:hypothetical protein